MKLLKIFLLLLSLNTTMVLANYMHCEMREAPACEVKLISKLSPWEYDESREYMSIRSSCIGNDSNLCIDKVFSNIPSWDQDDLAEVTKIANSCKQSNTACLNYLIKKLPKFELDSIEEMTIAAKACQNSSKSCIKKICNTRDFTCSRSRELIQAAKTCQISCN